MSLFSFSLSSKPIIIQKHTDIPLIPLSFRYISENIIITFFSTLIFTVLGWYFGLRIQPWYLPLSLIISSFFIFYTTKSFSSALCLPLLIVLSIFLSSFIIDYSCDSSGYHYPTSILLVENWNPLNISTYNSLYNQDGFYIVHYAKFVEIIGANIFAITDNVNSIKATNLIFFLATTFYVYYFLHDVLKTKGSLLITFVAMVNPVVCSQLLTGYIDQYLYYYIVLSLCLIIKYGLQGKKEDLFFLFIVTIFAIGTKFNAFFYQGLILIFATLWFFIKKQWIKARGIIYVGLLSLVSVLIFYWHPYVTNYIFSGNVFYPLLGENAVDILSPPASFEGHNRIYNFFYSLTYTWLNPSEHGLFVSFDQRRCGFTLWLAPLLLLSLVSLIANIKRWPKAAIYIFILIFLSCFIFETTWWARYIPQLWVLPVIAMVYTPFSLYWRGSFIILGTLSLFMAGINNWRGSLIYTFQTNHLLESISGKTIIPNDGLSLSDKHILKSNNIDWTAPDKKIPTTYTLNQRIQFNISDQNLSE